MCTVAVVAGPGGGYIVAQNRDERRTRSRGLPPGEGIFPLLCPRDPDGGGTWIGVNRAGISLCMLNAPDPPPEHLPASPVSRGTIPMMLAGATDRWELYRLVDGIDTSRYRPFHLVTVVPGEAVPEIYEFRWNGIVWSHVRIYPPALFVSSSLHPIPADRARGAAWGRFIDENMEPDREALAAFMENHEPEKSSLSTCMHREDAATVSRTVIEVDQEKIVMAYTDGSPCDPGSPTSNYEVSLTDSPR